MRVFLQDSEKGLDAVPYDQASLQEVRPHTHLFERQLACKLQSDGQLLHRIWNSGPEGRRLLQLY